MEPEESAPATLEARVGRGALGGFTEVASVIDAGPALVVENLSIEAIVFVETGRHLKAVRCPLFTVERAAPKTTITAYCEARKTALGKQAGLSVSAYTPDHNAVSGCGRVCEVRRNTRFSFIITDPSMTESAA